MIYNFIKDNYYTETTTPEGYVTRHRTKENKMNQRIENYKYDDVADPDRAEIKPKGPWIKENKMTRDEANRIMNKAGSVADGLEALGLIKFEEKKSMEDVVTKARMVCPKYEEFIAELDKHGYKIVSK